MIYALSLLGLWRGWLGSAIGRNWPSEKHINAPRYAGLLLLAVLGSPFDPALIAVNFIGPLYLARGYGHGPMLTLPIRQRTEGAPDAIYSAIEWITNDDARWWVYSLIRYVAMACPWSVGLYLTGHAWVGPFIGGLCIVATYRSLWPHRLKLPTFAIRGDETENWTELGGWTGAGAIVATCEFFGVLLLPKPDLAPLFAPLLDQLALMGRDIISAFGF